MIHTPAHACGKVTKERYYSLMVLRSPHVLALTNFSAINMNAPKYNFYNNEL